MMNSKKLNTNHIQDLEKSGLSKTTIGEAGIYSATEREIKNILGFSIKNSPGLAFPYPGTNGNQSKPYIRIKIDHSPKIKGKCAKYLSPKGSKNRLYIPPGVEKILVDPAIPLYLTEGEKKALKAVQEGMNCIGLAGVWCWKGKVSSNESVPIPDLDLIHWKGRQVFIIFDSDVGSKPEVKKAEKALAKELTHRGAIVRAIRLPDRDTEKIGLDDYLCGHTLIELLQLPQIDPLKGKVHEEPETIIRKLKDELLDQKKLVNKIRKLQELKPFERKRALSNIVIEDLKSRGAFYKTVERNHYYFEERHKILFDIEGYEFPKYLNNRYGINRSESEFSYLMEELASEAYLRGRETEIRRFAFYDNSSHVLYVSNNINQFYRLDGEVVTLVDNGTDGVLFIDNPMLQPFEYLEGDEKGHIKHLIIGQINFSTGDDSKLNLEECRFLFSLWLCALAFESLLPTKPILLLTGPKGSGKTSTLKFIGNWLFGKDFNVSTLSKDKEDSFISAISSQYFVAYDNVDGKIGWLNDRLATASTGQLIQLRKLYTTNEMLTFYPRCFLSLTSRTPKFKRDDVTDRLLIFKMKRFEKFTSERELIAEILAYRNHLWTEWLNNLNVIISSLKRENESHVSSFRMADFADFALKVSRCLGKEAYAQAIFDKMSREQSEFLLEDNPISQALTFWLDVKDNLGREIKSADLYQELKDAALREEISFPIENVYSFGHRMKNIVPNIEDCLEVKINVVSGKANKKFYKFEKRELS